MINLNNKRILVTGGAGFLGSHLCRSLLNTSCHVTCIDNFYTGRRENIAPFLKHKNFTFIEHDIIAPLDIKNDIDIIFNFACPASPPHYQKDPIFTTKTSILGTINMLEIARKRRARIVQASTSEVYGNPEKHPQDETYLGSVNPIGIRSCYDEGKRCAESLCFDYHRTYNVNIKVIRIFNTYGPHMDPHDGRVVSNFIMQALTSKPITIYGDGTQTRSFCYVDDLIKGIFAMASSQQNFTGPVNLGSNHEFTLLELSSMILELTGSRSKITFSALPQDDPVKRQPDISLANQQLRWQPQVSLKQGLVKTIEYFKTIVCNTHHKQPTKQSRRIDL